MAIDYTGLNVVDEATNALLQRAEVLAGAFPIGIEHLMLAILEVPPYQRLTSCPTIAAILRDPTKVGQLRGALTMVSAAHEMGVASIGGFTPVAREHLMHAQGYFPARELLDVGIVASILLDDNDVSRAFRVLAPSLGTSPEAMTGELRSVVDPFIGRGNNPIRQVHLPDGIIPGPDSEFAVIHRRTMVKVGLALVKCTPSQIAVVVGEKGSEVDRVGQMFADCLHAQSQARFTEDNNPLPHTLREYRSVYRYDLTQLLYSYDSARTESRDYLRDAFTYVKGKSAILILDHLEILSANGQAEKYLTDQLLRPSGAKVIGVYHLSESESREGSQLTLPISLAGTIADEVRIEHYSVTHALRTVRDYFLAQKWRNKGFAFQMTMDSRELEELQSIIGSDQPGTKQSEGDIETLPYAPFKHLINLEPGTRAWTGLPYLLVNVAEDLMTRTSEFGEALQLELQIAMRRTALERLKELLSTSGSTPKAILDYFQPHLTAVQEEILNMPELTLSGARLITRAHLMVEFFGSGFPRFQFPQRLTNETPTALTQRSPGHHLPIEEVPKKDSPTSRRGNSSRQP